MTRPDRATLEALFEGAPRFVERLTREDTDSYDELFARAERIATDMTPEEQIELLNAHPRIGAPPASVSSLSFREQGYDRDAAPDDLQQRLTELNSQYEARHGFRFVVFVDGRSRAEIADLMPAHVERDTADERARGLRDVVAIARSRRARMTEEQGE